MGNPPVPAASAYSTCWFVEADSGNGGTMARGCVKFGFAKGCPIPPRGAPPPPPPPPPPPFPLPPQSRRCLRFLLLPNRLCRPPPRCLHSLRPPCRLRRHRD